MIVLGKTFDELMDQSLRRLLDSGLITNLSRGSIARAILESFNENISEYYGALDTNMALTFISEATGIYLDLFGHLMDCERLDGEDDENYRYRITHQIYNVASANEIAVRLRCYSVSGVRDIAIRRYTHGTGSFSVYVIPEDSSQIVEVCSAVQSALDEVAASGVRAYAMSPKMLAADINIQLIGTVADDIKREVRQQIMIYIESLNPGDTLVINEIIQRTMDVDESIKDVQLSNFAVNGRPLLLVNQESYWDEKFAANNVQVA